MTLQELIALIVARDVAGKLVGDIASYYTDLIRGSLHDSRPRGIQAVIWQSRRPRRGVTIAPRLLTIARYRSSYSVIERMARTLDRAALQMDILPVIVPLHPASLEGMSQDTPFVRRLERTGSLLYSPKIQ